VKLCKTFRGKKGGRVEALKNLSLAVEVGEVFGFLGPNGAGKSTTIKTLMGMLTPTSGAATIMGTDVKSGLARRHVGYLPENPAFYDFLNAEEYLLFVGNAFRMRQHSFHERSEAVLKQLELWEPRKRQIRSYSKGMVQRLGLAQVLLHDPDVYILDEPMSGLDPIGRALVKDIILDLKKRGKSVFFSTHITSDVETVCDRVGVITQGTLRSVEHVQSIVQEGIMGYTVYLRRTDGITGRNIEVPKEALQRFMTEIAGTGEEITLIEPRRKSLEEFFLAVVRGEAC